MEAELWKRVEELFQSALGLPPEDRVGFLRIACGGDAWLQNEVETLLMSAGEEDSFLQHSPVASAALSKGQKLGNFEILEPLGSGGMGEVYRARDPRLKRDVAIKVLPRAFAQDPERLARFEREARASSALNHPNIVCVYDLGKHEDTAWIASELVEGESLRQLMSKGRLPMRRVIDIARQIADGLAAAHAVGLVHRDLKPENAMVARDGRIKILDFGLAKRQSVEGAASVGITRPGMISGTPGYMSPEQISERPVDPRSDIFSLGVLVFEMLAGKRPFGGDTSVSAMNAVLAEEPAELPGAVPSGVARLVLHCLEKDPGRRLQSAADFSFALELQHETRKTVVPAKRSSLWWAAAGLSLVLVLAALWWSRLRVPETVPSLVLTRMTMDAGLTTEPALSRDGKLFAYASDRGGQGHLDVWVQQVGGGTPLQLTHGDADSHEPDFSPDGTQIVFRYEGEGGGIYSVPTLGGDARRLMVNGRSPRFSPDGKWVAGWTGWTLASVLGAGIGELFLIPSTGGKPQVLHNTGLDAAGSPIWLPDGKHLLVYGDGSGVEDWWVIPRDGGRAVPTGAFAVLEKQGFPFSYPGEIPRPGGWSGDWLLFSAKLGDSMNVWKIKISPQSWQVSGVAQRITSGSSLDVFPSVSPDGSVVYASVSKTTNIWMLPISLNDAIEAGQQKQLTKGMSPDTVPSLSADGKLLAFVSGRSGQEEAWLKDLETGRERALTTTGSVVGTVRISYDGSRVAFTKDFRVIFLVPTTGGLPEQICGDCGWLSAWSHDGKVILYAKESGNGFAVHALDLATKRDTLFLQHKGLNNFGVVFSPDDRWIALQESDFGGSHSRVFVGSVRDGHAPPESEWSPLATTAKFEALVWMDKQFWSPDGNRLYYVSNQDGFRCIWTQRLDPNTKRPIGAPTPVVHFHNARLSMANIGWGELEIDAEKDKLVYNLGELTGNIWSAKPQ